MFKNMLSAKEIQIMEETIERFETLPISTKKYVGNLITLWNCGKEKNNLLKELFKDSLTINLGKVENIINQEENYELYRKPLLTHILDIERLFFAYADEFKCPEFTEWQSKYSTEDTRTRVTSEEEYYAVQKLISFIENAYLTSKRDLSDTAIRQWIKNRNEFEAKFKIGDKTFTFHKGQKMGKVLRTIKEIGRTYNLINEESDSTTSKEVDNIMTKISQTKPTYFTGDLILSIHPMDFLTCSDNAHSWTSCMSIARQAEYCAATLEAMQSENVIMAYVQSEDVKYYINASTYWNSKKWRQFIHLTEDLLINNKPYPFSHNQISKYVIDFIYSKLNLDKLGYQSPIALTKEQLCLINYDSSIMYNDYIGLARYSSSGVIIYVSAHNTIDFDDEETITIKFNNIALCPICFNELYREWSWDVIGCDDCITMEWCDCCEEYVASEVTYIDSMNWHVCDSCLDQEFSACSHCGNPVLTQDTVEVENKVLCEDCVYEHVFTCQTCGDSIYTPENGQYVDSVEGYVCDTCLDKEFSVCSHCGELVLTQDTVEVEDKILCNYNNCAYEHVVTCENCGISAFTPEEKVYDQDWFCSVKCREDYFKNREELEKEEGN